MEMQWRVHDGKYRVYELNNLENYFDDSPAIAVREDITSIDVRLLGVAGWSVDYDERNDGSRVYFVESQDGKTFPFSFASAGEKPSTKELQKAALLASTTSYYPIGE